MRPASWIALAALAAACPADTEPDTGDLMDTDTDTAQDTDTDTDTDTDPPVHYDYHAPEACPGATRIRVDGPDGFYNVLPRSLVNFEGRLWVTAASVSEDDRTWHPALWAPLDCSGEDPPQWRMVGQGSSNGAYLVAGHDRLLLGTTTGDRGPEAQFLTAAGDPTGEPLRLDAPASRWGLTDEGFYVFRSWTDERLDLQLIDADLEPGELRSFEDVPRDGGVALLGPPTQPAIGVVDEEGGRLILQRLDGHRVELDLPLGRVNIMPPSPHSPFFVRYEVDGPRILLTDGNRERELALPDWSFRQLIAPEGEGFWLANQREVYWLDAWDAELEQIGTIADDPDLRGYAASQIVGAGEDRVAVLFLNTSHPMTSTIRIFER